MESVLTKEDNIDGVCEVIEAERVSVTEFSGHSPTPVDPQGEVDILADEAPQYDVVHLKNKGMEGLFMKADHRLLTVVAEPLTEGDKAFVFSRETVLGFTRDEQLVPLVSFTNNRRGTTFEIVPNLNDTDSDVIELEMRKKDDCGQTRLDWFVVRFESGYATLESLYLPGYYVSIERRGVVLRKRTEFPPSENYLVDMQTVTVPVPTRGRFAKAMVRIAKVLKGCVK